jgi:hypothetical protein
MFLRIHKNVFANFSSETAKVAANAMASVIVGWFLIEPGYQHDLICI